MGKDLAWEVTSEERRGQIQSFISKSWVFFVLMVLIIPFFYMNTFLSIQFFGIGQFLYTIGYSVFGVALALGMLFFLNKVLHYQNRCYRADEKGIEISVGKKNKKFLWDDFKYFYYYSLRGQTLFQSNSGNILQEGKGQIEHVAREVEGGIFYLEKKSRGILGFGKVFVVVYAEPDNTDIVADFLRQKLSERQMTASSDLGLVFYKFK